MLIKNGIMLNRDFCFMKNDIKIQNGVIVETGGNISNNDILDAEGCYIIPGLVDIHTHGCGGVDADFGTEQAFDIMSKIQGENGITSFCLTTMTLPENELLKTFSAVKKYQNKVPEYSKILGINMEGPFFNMNKKGGHKPEFLILPDYKMFKRLNDASGNNVRIVNIAPELKGAIDFILKVSKITTVSIAHTNCDYETAIKAINSGATHVTHLYNAMRNFSHRDSGLIGAANDTDVFAELICDGIHVSPPAVRIAFKIMKDRICLISDSMAACGVGNGTYQSGKLAVTVKDRKVTLADGTIAGSATNLFECMKNAISFGIPVETAIKSATLNPAKSIREERKIGSLDIGKDADIIVTDKNFNIKHVFFKGKKTK
jgi:N-acetylglucosamine-6-phosphate deacetylase